MALYSLDSCNMTYTILCHTVYLFMKQIFEGLLDSMFGVFIINSNQIWDILFGRLPFSEEEEVEEEEEEEEDRKASSEILTTYRLK